MTDSSSWHYAELGNLIDELVTAVTANTAALQALANKLDSDPGVVDTDYGRSLTTALTRSHFLGEQIRLSLISERVLTDSPDR